MCEDPSCNYQDDPDSREYGITTLTPYDSEMTMNIQDHLNHLTTGAAYDSLDEETECPGCFSPDHTVHRDNVINLPEVLVLYIPRLEKDARHFVDTPLFEELHVPGADGYVVSKLLSSLC